MSEQKEGNLKGAGAYQHIEKHEAEVKHFAIAGVAVFLISIHLVWPLNQLVFGGISTEIVAEIGEYFRRLLSFQYPFWMKAYYYDWAVWAFSNHPPDQALVHLVLWIVPPLLGFALYAFARSAKVNDVPNIYGDSHFADEKDIKKMEQEDLVGFERGKLMMLGVFKGRYIRLCETLSTLLLAPPGAGKSVGFIAPSIVNMDSVSVLVHDLKPELHTMTSGYRQKLGPVYMLKWGATDKPEGDLVPDEDLGSYCADLLLRDEKGELVRDPASGMVRTRPIFYPSWNPISPGALPTDDSQRDLYIERLANVLCPDPTGGGDRFWTSKARGALVGLVHYLIAKVETGNWSSIPESWHGKEACFPMLVDWFTQAQLASTEGEDPMRELFRNAVEEARHANEGAIRAMRQEPYPQRCIVELTDLMNSPDKTRGSILTTMNEALLPFKQASVRERTSKSDIDFSDLRGIPSPEARKREEAKKRANPSYRIHYSKSDYEPITIYICVSLQDATALSVISGIFVESANNYLVSFGPNAIDDHGRRLGPYAFGMLLDEAPQMPKLKETIIKGPATGRSKEVFYVIVGQDFAQFEERYSKPDVETLISTTAVKVVLSQNNDSAAKRISEMAGKFTYRKTSYSDRSGGGNKPPILKMFEGSSKKSKSESFEGVELLKPSFLMSLPKSRHVLMVQNHQNTPILCDTPNHFAKKSGLRRVISQARPGGAFRYPDLAERIFNARTMTGPTPSAPMPLDEMNEIIERRELEKTIREARKKPQITLVVTPRDIQSLRRDKNGEPLPRGKEYAFVEVTLYDEGPDFCTIEPDAEIKVVQNVAELSDELKRKRFLVYDQHILAEEINRPLQEMGLKPLAPEFAEFLLARALASSGEPAQPDLFALGQEGAVQLRLPSDATHVTPRYALKWMADIMTHIMGLEEQLRIIKHLDMG